MAIAAMTERADFERTNLVATKLPHCHCAEADGVGDRALARPLGELSSWR